MDGAWRRPTDSSLREGTPSPSEVPSGGEKSVLLTFALFKSEPPSGGTIGGRYRKNGYVLGLIQHPRGRYKVV